MRVCVDAEMHAGKLASRVSVLVKATVKYIPVEFVRCTCESEISLFRHGPTCQILLPLLRSTLDSLLHNALK